MDAQRLLPPPRLRSLSLQQMALVRGGQVTDDPAPPPRAPEPCPAPSVPSPSCSLRHQPPPPCSPSSFNTSSFYLFLRQPQHATLQLFPPSSGLSSPSLPLTLLSSGLCLLGQPLPPSSPQWCRPSGRSRWLERARRRRPLTWEPSQTWPTANA
nr:PREDICTED: WAS/WASL-interacting protein family member 3-like isoform X1 [Paralichthys olivaceus]